MRRAREKLAKAIPDGDYGHTESYMNDTATIPKPTTTMRCLWEPLASFATLPMLGIPGSGAFLTELSQGMDRIDLLANNE